jgi:mono/diheme cytochrome c family protein
LMKLARILGYGLLILVAVVIFGFLLTIGFRPLIGPRARPVTNRVFDRTAPRLVRGKYLVESVAACTECHSPHDWTKHDAPTPPGMLAAGEHFPVAHLPGTVVAANLTPDTETGIGSWTDDQIARAIREGVDRQGRALFPLMPYTQYKHLSDEDLASVVVYLRALPPVRNPLPPSNIIFPVKYLIRSAPEPVTSPVPEADGSTPVSRGQYLVEIGGCADCHTPQRRGQPLPGMSFAGGFVLEGPWGRVASSNITADASGISYYDAALFRQAMRTGYVQARPLNQIMPWEAYRGMTDEDLAAIFAYLRTLAPVRHRVDNAASPSECRRCKTAHGLGDQN